MGTIAPVGYFVPQLPDLNRSDSDILQRRASIVAATLHAWNGYERAAFGTDELGPITGTGKDTFAKGLGTTIVDSLGTLYLMGLDKEYITARNWVENELDFGEVAGNVIVFETVIRILGGLLSAFHLTGDEMFAEKAEELGVRLAPSLDTRTGYPWPKCSLKHVGHCTYHSASSPGIYLAEVGSVQMEYRALSFHSTDPFVSGISMISDKIIDRLQNATSVAPRLIDYPQLLPSHLSLISGKFSTNLITLGAPADSYFEYLIKLYLQSGKREKKYFELFKSVVTAVLNVGTYTSANGDRISRDIIPSGGSAVQYSHRMDHFSCFLPGALILGLDELDDPQERKAWERLAENLAETCYKMYSKSPSGLSGESIRLGKNDMWHQSGGYHLRPEAVEAFFYMWRHTKDEKYRSWAWEVFEAIEKHCKTPYGYAVIKNARSRYPQKEDHMHSFLIAETFKYLYLIFEEDEVLPLDKWVFNTEAHPLLITPAMGVSY